MMERSRTDDRYEIVGRWMVAPIRSGKLCSVPLTRQGERYLQSLFPPMGLSHSTRIPTGTCTVDRPGFYMTKNNLHRFTEV